MVSVTEFIVMLLTSIVELVQTFLSNVIIGGDPLSIVSIISGTIFIGVASAYFGYAVLGAVANLFSGTFSFETGQPPQQE